MRVLLLILFLLNSSNLFAADCEKEVADVKKELKNCHVLSFIVGTGPGGGTDLNARLVQDIFMKAGQTVVVQNRPGASGLIASQALQNLSRAETQCSVMVAANTVFTANPTVFAGRSPTMSDYSPISVLSSHPWLVAVKADSPLKTMDDLNKAIQERGQDLNAGVAGPASPERLAALAWFNRIQPSSRAPKLIPHQSTAETMSMGLLAGEKLDFAIVSPGSARGLWQSGRIRILARTGNIAVPKLDVPLLSDSVPGFPNTNSWIGMVASKKMEANRVSAISKAVQCAIQSEKFKSRMSEIGYEAGGAHGAEMTQQVATEEPELRRLLNESDKREQTVPAAPQPARG